MRRKYMLRLVPTNDNNAGKTHPSTCLFKQDIAPWLFKNLGKKSSYPYLVSFISSYL